ncbi:type VI secretion system tip protein VgrG, partial [Nissabacter archeti]
MKIPPPIFFDHRHHLLRVRGCTAELDMLGLTAEEALSRPFCYTLTFTCTDKALDPGAFLLQDATLTLQAPVDPGSGIRLMQPVRVVQGVVTRFTRLATSKDESLYALALQPRLALLSRSRQNAIYQDMSVPQIVEKVLRERHDMRGQDFVFTLSHEYPRREQVMQYGEDDLTF